MRFAKWTYKSPPGLSVAFEFDVCGILFSGPTAAIFDCPEEFATHRIKSVVCQMMVWALLQHGDVTCLVVLSGDAVARPDSDLHGHIWTSVPPTCLNSHS